MRSRAASTRCSRSIGLADRADDKSDEFSRRHEASTQHRHRTAARPKLLVLDEPTVGVDPQSRNAILESVEQLSTAGHGRPLHHPLHGRGRASLRPRRHHRSRARSSPRGPAASSSSSSASTTASGSARRGDLEAAAEAVRGMPGVREAAVTRGRTRHHRRLRRPMCCLTCSPRSWPRAPRSRSADIDEPNLEAVFLHLTGRALRD